MYTAAIKAKQVTNVVSILIEIHYGEFNQLFLSLYSSSVWKIILKLLKKMQE